MRFELRYPISVLPICPILAASNPDTISQGFVLV
jgi:hypothetical protein